MSKKKNTLKDLDDFLKQQAATLVVPSPLANTQPSNELTSIKDKAENIEKHVSADSIINEIKVLSHQESKPLRQTLYNIILSSLENQPTSPEDKMLINTVLYLQSGSQWKEKIREYWRRK